MRYNIIRETSNLDEERSAAERQRVEHAIREACGDEQRTIQRLRDETRGLPETRASGTR